jgi:branched-chain amino acid transport system substrate-binding protein
MTRHNNVLAVLASTLAFGLAGPVSAQISGDSVKIGFITDLSGLYSDTDGTGGIEAIRMAIADFGGSVDGKKIELLTADHQNKADIAAGKAREWIDREGVDMIVGGTNSATSLSMAKIAAEKKKPFLSVGAGTARLTNEECTPYTVHYAYDTVALARGTGGAVVKQGGKTWFFLTADYAFGTSLENDTAAVVKASGGKVLGSVRHPLSASDFSSFLLQAQASKAQILGLADAGGDTINAIKSANEFGITKTMKLAGLLMFITDVHSLTPALAKGMYLTDNWYWDRDEASRAFAKRFYAKEHKMPSSLQAADYSSTLQYLKAVKAAGTDDGDKVMAQLRSMKLDDMYVKNGTVRPDGTMVHDMYLMQVKEPGQVKQEWDLLNIVQTIPGEQAWTTKAETKCSLWK